MKRRQRAPMQSQSKELPQVSFVVRRAAADASKADAFILPLNKKFNDFGFYLSCLIGFRGKSGEVEWFDGKCAVSGIRDTAEYISGILSSEGVDEYPAKKISLPFRTLLIDARSYGLIRRIVGPQQGRSLLLATQDIAIKRGTPFYLSWPNLTHETIFTHALVRSSEAYFALRRGERFLRGLREVDAEIRTGFTINLRGKGPEVSFSFKFDRENFLRGRISVIIGHNGCGKTSALARISRVMGSAISKSGDVADRPEINQVLAFIHTSSRRQFSSTSKEGGASTRVFTFNPAVPAKQSDDPITRLLVDVVRAYDAQGELVKNFASAIKEEFRGLDMYVPVRGESEGEWSVEYIEFSKWIKGGEQKRLESAASAVLGRPLLFKDQDGSERGLSLGQQSFLRFTLTALANAGPGSLFVIDEPENFLHPNLISRFMRSLNRVLDGTQSIAIVATHSPFVVREVQSAQVHVMREVEGRVVVSHPLMQTLGANVTAISNEVFGDDMHEHLYEDLLALAAERVSRFDEVLDQFSSELSLEAMMALRRKMESV